MLKRLSFAFVGAALVTAGLILGMSEIAKLFERPDSPVYMRVMDFIPGAGGRHLPDKRMPQTQPERARIDPEIDGAAGTGAPPTFEDTEQEIEVRVDLDPLPEDAPQ